MQNFKSITILIVKSQSTAISLLEPPLCTAHNMVSLFSHQLNRYHEIDNIYDMLKLYSKQWSVSSVES